MAEIHVRGARLDDTAAISALFRARIAAWQRLDTSGHVEDVAYEALTLYERWLHGGAWMSVETGAIHLSHLLRGAGLALVAEVDGAPLAYAEAYPGHEPAPYGDHLHLAHLVVAPQAQDEGLDEALIDALLGEVKRTKAQHLTLSRAGAGDDLPVYEHVTLTPLARVRRLSLPARTGQIFFQSVEHLKDDAAQINGWHMPIGRLESARQGWEMLWPRTWDALPEIRARRAHRIRFSAAGQEAFVYAQPQLYNPRAVEIYAWSPRPLTTQLLSALRDWAHRESYRTLVLAVAEETVKILGAEAEPDGYAQETCAVTRG
jgi:GNAT superfamily N-acetyltransferase